MVIAGDQHIALKRHVGLREREQWGTVAPFGAVIGLAVDGGGLGSNSLVLCFGSGKSATLAGSKKPVGLSSVATSARWLAACPAFLNRAESATRGSVASVPRSALIRSISAFCSLFTSLVNWNNTGS